MLDKLKQIKIKYDELSRKIEDGSVPAGSPEWTKLCKEHAALTPVVEKHAEYDKVLSDLADAREMQESERDPSMLDFLYAEVNEGLKRQEQLENELKILLLPPDPNDDKNVIMEIRAAAGGDEAGLFAAELMRMYKMYAANNRWQVEDLDINTTEAGGVKEASFTLSGNMIFSKLKYESGVHRVQRVPETETQGRVHTSTVTVAVLPEATDVEIEILEKDLKIDTFRSGGAGGQHVNKTESSIRITHLPTDIVVVCQDERSQIKNRDKAMRALKTKLYDHFQTIADKEYAATRRGQVGTGDRSERIRTYNFPQGRITDHRIGLTLYNINKFMLGDIDEMLDALRMQDQADRLKSSE